MSFLSALFGRLAPASAEKVPEPVEYKGFIIRADAFASYDDAANFALSKARQIIDLQGDRIFG